MHRILWALAALLLIPLAGCATPRQPQCMPGVDGAAAGPIAQGGVSAESKPETGRTYGVPNPTSTYARGDAEVWSDYDTESRQAGAIANPKVWSGNVEATGSVPASPACVRAAGRQLELIGIQAASLDPGSEAWKSVMDRGHTLLAFMATEGAAYMEQVIQLSPSWERCVMVNIDNAGSATGGAESVPEGLKEIAKEAPNIVKESGTIINGEFVPYVDEAEDADLTDDSHLEPPAGVALPVEGGTP